MLSAEGVNSYHWSSEMEAVTMWRGGLSGSRETLRCPRPLLAAGFPAGSRSPASHVGVAKFTCSTPSALSPGVVRQVRPIVGPFHAVLKLEMNYVVGGVVSHRNVVNVHIFVSEYWF